MILASTAFDAFPAELRDSLIATSKELPDSTLEIPETTLAALISQHLRTHPAAPPQRGLGDILHTLIHPIAVASDTLLGTTLRTCPTCAQRQATLNTLFPLP